MPETLKTSKKYPPSGKTAAEKQFGLTREKFIEDMIAIDEWHKRKHAFSFQLFTPIGQDHACSAVTIDQQFHNTLNKLRECWFDKTADQLFWELQVRKLRDFAAKEYELADVMISTTYNDDIYLLNDKIVMMRPCYKASSPESWAYVVMHEVGHHVINRNRSVFSDSIKHANHRAFFSKTKNTKIGQVNLFEVEVIAWHEGMRAAKAAGAHVVDLNFEKVKSSCLKSYAVIE